MKALQFLNSLKYPPLFKQKVGKKDLMLEKI